MTDRTSPETATVPREPTREMWAAMASAVVGKTTVHHDVVVAAFYEAMLASAPKFGVAGPEVQTSPVSGPFKDGDPLVTALIWEVDRAVKQAMRESGKYETTIRHILNEHLCGHAQTLDLSWVKDLLDLYFSPWGAAKAARFEAMTGDTPFDPEAVLKLIHEKLTSPVSSPDRTIK